jgi:hypothetical protein
MAAVLIQGPAIEPLSLADAKLFLRVAHADECLTVKERPGNDFVVAYAVPGEPGNDGTPVR